MGLFFLQIEIETREMQQSNFQSYWLYFCHAVDSFSIEMVASPLSRAQNDLPPEPHPSYHKYLESRATSLTPNCGEEIFNAIFKEGNVSLLCCHIHILVVMGKDCDEALVNVIDSLFPSSYA
ncbi:Prolamin-like domain [Quillaja saponaria]|uniref:Prolamin-like domain n=1 Tax=Quillaja saponaria TaxID=32244 RepID=A0AAD7PTL2_QUISA|nr:Prolamin-like domain [Quillaja saponaria]